MTAKAFVDSNVLIYAVSNRRDEAAKAKTAREILNRSDIGFSVQVFQEFHVNATRKIKRPIAHEDSIAFIKTLTRFPVQPLSADVMFYALNLQDRFQLSYWDAAILAAANFLKASILYTEDLNPGQKYDSVTVENPFAN